MAIDWARVAPVIVSIGIIITVAILREYSRTFAAIAATMPINIPLGLWIVASGDADAKRILPDFTQSIFLNMLPTMLYVVVVWQMARAGYTLLPMIIGGYIAWAIALGILMLLRQHFGF